VLLSASENDVAGRMRAAICSPLLYRVLPSGYIAASALTLEPGFPSILNCQGHCMRYSCLSCESKEASQILFCLFVKK